MRVLVVSLCVLAASVAMLLLDLGNQPLLMLFWIPSSAVPTDEFRRLRSPTGWKESVIAAAIGPAIVFALVIIHYIFFMRPLPESLQELFSRFVELIYFTLCGLLVIGTFGGTIGIIWHYQRKTADRASPQIASTPGDPTDSRSVNT